MNAAPAKRPPIRIAVVESDPLRFVGFRALFDSEPDFELKSASLPDVGGPQNIDLVLLGDRFGQNLFDVLGSLKATHPHVRTIVTGSGMDEDTILKAIAFGAKGYVGAAASPSDFVRSGLQPRALPIHLSARASLRVGSFPQAGTGLPIGKRKCSKCWSWAAPTGKSAPL